MPNTVTVHDGTEVEVDHVKSLPSGGARFDVVADTRKWRIDITRGGNVELVTSWKDGSLAEVEIPDWMDDIVARLQHQ